MDRETDRQMDRVQYSMWPPRAGRIETCTKYTMARVIMSQRNSVKLQTALYVQWTMAKWEG